MLMCLGHCHWGDLGSMATSVRVIWAILPYDFFASAFSYFAPYLGDYQKYNSERGIATARAVPAAPTKAVSAEKKSRSRSGSRKR